MHANHDEGCDQRRHRADLFERIDSHAADNRVRGVTGEGTRPALRIYEKGHALDGTSPVRQVEALSMLIMVQTDPLPPEWSWVSLRRPVQAGTTLQHSSARIRLVSATRNQPLSPRRLGSETFS